MTMPRFRYNLQKPKAKTKSLVGKVKFFMAQRLILMIDFSRCICICSCMSPKMEMLSLRSESRQYEISSCWINKRVNESLCLGHGSAQYSGLKYLGLGNMFLSVVFEKKGVFQLLLPTMNKRVFLFWVCCCCFVLFLSVENSLEEYCSRAFWLYVTTLQGFIGRQKDRVL